MRLTLMLTLAALAVVLGPGLAVANDASAEVGAGGIQLRNERRVAMRRERLYISPDKVKVEYEFVNESREEVVTEVAFPVPAYEYSYAVQRWGDTFDDFRAWVGDKPIAVTKEVRAFKGERDVTSVLLSMGLEIESMARVDAPHEWVDGVSRAQIPKLPPEQQEQLRAQALIGTGKDDDEFTRFWPAWSVRITYHWAQRFPPGQVVRVRHEYTPAGGAASYLETPPEACVDAGLRKRLTPKDGRAAGTTSWVKYILTTANTWKTPIRDFELLIEGGEFTFVSLCWDGKITKAGPRLFRSALKDFVPKKELTVYFYNPHFE